MRIVHITAVLKTRLTKRICADYALRKSLTGTTHGDVNKAVSVPDILSSEFVII